MAWLKNTVCGVVLIVMALVCVAMLITVVRHELNRGFPSALNTVLGEARTRTSVSSREPPQNSSAPILGTVIDDETFTCRPRLCEGAFDGSLNSRPCVPAGDHDGNEREGGVHFHIGH
jgi:hypothetical protein